MNDYGLDIPQNKNEVPLHLFFSLPVKDNEDTEDYSEEIAWMTQVAYKYLPEHLRRIYFFLLKGLSPTLISEIENFSRSSFDYHRESMKNLIKIYIWRIKQNDIHVKNLWDSPYHEGEPIRDARRMIVLQYPTNVIREKLNMSPHIFSKSLYNFFVSLNSSGEEFQYEYSLFLQNLWSERIKVIREHESVH